jgi:hypothetical protein
MMHWEVDNVLYCSCSSHVCAGAYALLILWGWIHSVSDQQGWWGVSTKQNPVLHSLVTYFRTPNIAGWCSYLLCGFFVSFFLLGLMKYLFCKCSHYNQDQIIDEYISCIMITFIACGWLTILVKKLIDFHPRKSLLQEFGRSLVGILLWRKTKKREKRDAPFYNWSSFLPTKQIKLFYLIDRTLSWLAGTSIICIYLALHAMHGHSIKYSRMSWLASHINIFPCSCYGSTSHSILFICCKISCCSWIDAAKFLTGASAVGSIAIPIILRHAHMIETGAMWIEFTSFVIFVCTVMCFHRASLEDEWWLMPRLLNSDATCMLLFGGQIAIWSICMCMGRETYNFPFVNPLYLYLPNYIMSYPCLVDVLCISTLGSVLNGICSYRSYFWIQFQYFYIPKQL